MAFFFPKIQDVDLPGERCGHMAVYWKGNIVIWGGFTVRNNWSVRRFFLQTQATRSVIKIV